MHVLGMFHAYPPGHGAGAEWHAHSLLRDLVRRGHDVDVLLSHPLPGGDYTFDGVSVFGRRRKSDPFDRMPVDVIVTHLENTPRATIIGEVTGTPVVHLLHNTFDFSRRWLGRRPALAVFNSEWMASDFAANVPAFTGRSVVIRPPVAVADYATEPGDMVTMVNLFANKGGAQFWRIAAAMPRTKFLAVRGGYGEQVIPATVPGNVELIPNTADMRGDVYARTRILLMPSEYESWGRVGVEAMCSGIPVIAHPTPGLRESLGDAGVFVDRDDTDGWVAAIRRLSTPRAWAAASRRATARAQQLDPTADLDTFAAAMVDVAAAPRPRRRAS